MPKFNKKEKKELDDMWKLKVKQRDKYFCQVCNKKVLGRNCHAHHILPRGMKGMRWDVNNGITLCFRHHKVGNLSAHMNAIWFAYWLKTHKEAQFKYCINKLVTTNEK